MLKKPKLKKKQNRGIGSKIEEIKKSDPFLRIFAGVQRHRFGVTIFVSYLWTSSIPQRTDTSADKIR